jgi:hypothetical protein
MGLFNWSFIHELKVQSKQASDMAALLPLFHISVTKHLADMAFAHPKTAAQTEEGRWCAALL